MISPVASRTITPYAEGPGLPRAPPSMLALIAFVAGRGAGFSKRDFWVNGLPPAGWQGAPASRLQRFFPVRPECCKAHDRKLPGLHRCHTEETRPWDRYRAAGPQSLDSPYKLSLALFPAWRSVCPWQICNPGQTICPARYLPAEGSAGHACAQKMSAEPRHFAGSHKHRWPSECTRPRRAANHAPVASFQSARSDREAVRAEIQDDPALVFRVSTMPPSPRWD